MKDYQDDIVEWIELGGRMKLISSGCILIICDVCRWFICDAISSRKHVIFYNVSYQRTLPFL